MVALSLVTEARVRQRFREEQGVAELIFEALFEWIHAGRTRGLCMPWRLRQLGSHGGERLGEEGRRSLTLLS